MNNLKKIGLTALAGSLVSTSVAFAGELTVSGSASMNFRNFTVILEMLVNKVSQWEISVYFSGGGEIR